MPRHPRRSHLLALADRELPPAASLALRLHLLRCRRCRSLSEAMRSDRLAVSSALAALGGGGPAAEGWARFVVASGHPTPAATGVRAAILLLLALPALWLARPARRPRVSELATVARELAERPEGATSRPAREGTADVRFVDLISALRRSGQAEVIRDDCCADHDAEGPPDDGLLALQVNEPATSVLVMYDDVDRSRSLSRGDLVRWVSLTPGAHATRAWPVQVASRDR